MSFYTAINYYLNSLVIIGEPDSAKYYKDLYNEKFYNKKNVSSFKKKVNSKNFGNSKANLVI